MNISAPLKTADIFIQAWQLSLENTRREAKGLSHIKLLSELDEQETEDTASNDPYLVEGAHILTDFIGLTDKRIAQSL